MPKERKVSTSDKFWRATTKCDLFGERVRFNMDGKESFDTCCGSICTLAITAVVALYCVFQVRLYQSQWAEVPIVSSFVKEGFYLEPVEVRQDRDDFMFAVAITARQNFEEHTTEAFEATGGKISAHYIINGGPDDGKFHNIEMHPCSDTTFYTESGIEAIDKVTKAHLAVPQFFCPNAFDMSFYGDVNDADKKILWVDIKSGDDGSYLEGKHVAMLINTREIEFFDDYEQVRVHPFTKLMWMPINSLQPVSNTITFTNHEFFMKETEYDQYRYELKGVEKLEWISVDHEIESVPYPFPLSNPSVKCQILFQTSHDLESTVHRSDRLFFINIGALLGGAFFAMYFVIRVFFKLWVSWLMHLTIVRNLFKIDPSQDKKKKSMNVMKRKNPKVLLEEARTVAKKRVSMTRSACDRFVLLAEALLGTILCKATKFGKILAEGKREVKTDLNVYNYMQKLRLLQGTVNALTTFNQRRLLEHQVETSFLLKPYSSKHDPDAAAIDKKKKEDEKKKAQLQKKKFVDSESASSEEDFYFLEQALKEAAELDPVDQRLLMGIIQAPPKEKKRWDKEDPEEIRRRKKEKALARGEHWSDSYDEETDHEGLGFHEHDDLSLRGDGSVDLLGGKKSGKDMMSAV